MLSAIASLDITLSNNYPKHLTLACCLICLLILSYIHKNVHLFYNQV